MNENIQFSIILPVRNGGNYVKECVNSILNQTYPQYNLIVLDNCSSDGTLEWIQSLKHEKIIIHPSPIPLTIEQNWARILTVPKKEFMTIIGHDDILHENFLLIISELVSQHPDASLFHTHFNYIDFNGKHIRDCLAMDQSETDEAFLRKYLIRKIDVMGTGYVTRSADYDKEGGIPLYPNLLFADFELWFKLIRKEIMVVSPVVAFSFRIHKSTTTISGDLKYHQAFEQLISFFHSLLSNNNYKRIIIEYGNSFLLFYCKALSHRLLRSADDIREGVTVNNFINRCRAYAKKLGINEKFSPEKVWSIQLALWIDAYPISRKMFRTFKKLVPKPILR